MRSAWGQLSGNQLSLKGELQNIRQLVGELHAFAPNFDSSLRGGATRLRQKTRVSVNLLHGFAESLDYNISSLHGFVESLEHSSDAHRYRIQDVNGDGACVSHALALQVPQSCDELRSLVATYIAEHPEMFAPFLVRSSVDAYLDQLRRTNTWADHLVIQAASDILKRDVMVFRLCRPPLQIGERASRVPIHIFHNLDHFSAILEGVSPSQSQSLIQSGEIDVGASLVATPSPPRAKGQRSRGFPLNLRVCSLNVSSLRKHWMTLLNWGYDVLLLQDIFLDAKAQKFLEGEVLSAGYRPLWGQPTKCQGGVAILVRDCLHAKRLDPIHHCVAIQQLFEQGRVIHVVLAVGRKGRMLHLASYYGISGASSCTRDDGKFEKNEATVGAVFAYTQTFGDVPGSLGVMAMLVSLLHLSCKVHFRVAFMMLLLMVALLLAGLP